VGWPECFGLVVTGQTSYIGLRKSKVAVIFRSQLPRLKRSSLAPMGASFCLFEAKMQKEKKRQARPTFQEKPLLLHPPLLSLPLPSPLPEINKHQNTKKNTPPNSQHLYITFYHLFFVSLLPVDLPVLLTNYVCFLGWSCTFLYSMVLASASTNLVLAFFFLLHFTMGSLPASTEIVFSGCPWTSSL
jgi:hypothetical protein